jgi:CRP-like cAMP-binding protein
MMLPLHLSYPSGLPDNLTSGRDALTSLFNEGSPLILRAGQRLANLGHAGDLLYRLKAGWAYRFRDLAGGNRPIVDIYLPGDIIGFDAALCGGPITNVTTLTTTAVETLSSETGLGELMSSPPIGLYIAWLLNEQQRRTDFMRAATAALDARGRLAAMVLDFYCRLEAQRLITNSSFSLPLTQNHIGSYLGLTVVHVNRVIRCLREDGVVNIEKHCVSVFNLPALATLAKIDVKNLAKTELARSYSTPASISLQKIEPAAGL